MKADSQSQSNQQAPSLCALPVALALLCGLALRLWMLDKFFLVDGDSLVYGGIAKNILLHGRYAIEGVGGELYPTLIRLPGYPLYLAACFQLFGIDNYAPAVWIQIALDLAGCLLLADFARLIVPPALRSRAAMATLWLAALCPFTAIYAAEPLTESLTLFVIALGLWSAARFRQQPSWTPALVFTFAVAYAALLRPDGVLVGVALAPALVIGLRNGVAGRTIRLRKAIRMAVACLLLALAPFAAWGWRNWKVFRIVQPLAPRYANDPDEEVRIGWIRWVRTWCLDFASTYDIYWNVPGGPLDLNQLPRRAFDSPDQYARTAQLAQDYNRTGQQISSDLDRRFGQLAAERVQSHPLRSYLWLPLGRMADMWLRPRVENLPIDTDWWVYQRHKAETRFAWSYAALNALLLLLALAGLWIKPRLWPWMLVYLVLRSALLTTIEAPEARYTLECFPILFALGGISLASAWPRITVFCLSLAHSVWGLILKPGIPAHKKLSRITRATPTPPVLHVQPQPEFPLRVCCQHRRLPGPALDDEW
jgi:hypothetical protein